MQIFHLKLSKSNPLKLFYAAFLSSKKVLRMCWEKIFGGVLFPLGMKSETGEQELSAFSTSEHSRGRAKWRTGGVDSKARSDMETMLGTKPEALNAVTSLVNV